MSTIPLLPLMYRDGKRIRSKVPRLPEAEGTNGIFSAEGSHKSIRLVTIGESTVAGVGVHTHTDGFTGALARELSHLFSSNVEWSVYAKSGYTAKMVTKRLVPEIDADSPDIIVIGLGGNDAFTLNSPARWRRDIRKLIQALLGMFPGVNIVFINMPPIKEFPAFTPVIKFSIGNLVEILGEELKYTIRPYENVFYADEKITLERWAVKAGEGYSIHDFFSDGVHPSRLTYETWAGEIAKTIHSRGWLVK